MNLLITGGLGYIGAHLSVELLKSNTKVFVLDDLSNSSFTKKKISKNYPKKKSYLLKMI